MSRIEIRDIPKRDSDVTRFKYIKRETEPEKGTQAELMQKFKSAHDALWDGGALVPTTAFDELDKLIFCKIWDERWRDNDPKSIGKPFDFQTIYYAGDKDASKAKTELGKRVNALYEQGRKKTGSL